MSLVWKSESQEQSVSLLLPTVSVTPRAVLASSAVRMPQKALGGPCDSRSLSVGSDGDGDAAGSCARTVGADVSRGRHRASTATLARDVSRIRRERCKGPDLRVRVRSAAWRRTGDRATSVT